MIFGVTGFSNAIVECATYPENPNKLPMIEKAKAAGSIALPT